MRDRALELARQWLEKAGHDLVAARVDALRRSARASAGIEICQRTSPKVTPCTTAPTRARPSQPALPPWPERAAGLVVFHGETLLFAVVLGSPARARYYYEQHWAATLQRVPWHVRPFAAGPATPEQALVRIGRILAALAPDASTPPDAPGRFWTVALEAAAFTGQASLDAGQRLLLFTLAAAAAGAMLLPEPPAETAE
jgi:hypothetical protein